MSDNDPRDYDPFPHAPKAGRELDVGIAKAMGCKPDFRNADDWHCTCADQRHGMTNHADEPPTRDSLLAFYSTDIAAAWEVVEKLKCIEVAEPTVKWACAVIQATPRGTWQATFRFHTTEADTAPLAICLAALKAVQP